MTATEARELTEEALTDKEKEAMAAVSTINDMIESAARRAEWAVRIDDQLKLLTVEHKQQVVETFVDQGFIQAWENRSFHYMWMLKWGQEHILDVGGLMGAITAGQARAWTQQALADYEQQVQAAIISINTMIERAARRAQSAVRIGETLRHLTPEQRIALIEHYKHQAFIIEQAQGETVAIAWRPR